MNILELDGVSRTFPGVVPVEALRRCDLCISPGQLITVSGPSGSGKSTLLNVAGLLDRPTEGRVVVQGTDTTELGEGERAALRGRHIGFVFQAFHLMMRRSVVDNVSLAGLYQGVPADERAERARRAVDVVGLSHRADAPASLLSGGERQRVAIARAIAGEPGILLCDEPTGNLDTENSASIVELLRTLNADGAAIVIITHDRDIAAIGEVRLRIQDGVVSRE